MSSLATLPHFFLVLS
jgi:hypothetical protein